MKTLSSEPLKQRTMRRFSKPVMEKRRRERINHSLETLRLLMLENSRNEKLKNPKVEKAEILESVVHFLRTGREVQGGHRAVKRGLSGERSPARARQHNYQDGMRSCLLRVSQFIASKSQETGESEDGVQVLPEPQTHPSSPGHLHRSLIPSPPGALSPQHLPHHHLHQHGLTHPYLTQVTGLHCGTGEFFSSRATSTYITDPVWRPWPQ